MDQETVGTVVTVARQWWLKVNTKSIRFHAMDGATFPHVIKVRYTVNGVDYIKRKWIHAGRSVPVPGAKVAVLYCSAKPARAKVYL